MANQLPTIDVARVKAYNAELKQYTEKSGKLTAEYEFTRKELDRLCAELSQELGVQVTTENLEAVYTDRVNTINSTVETGEQVLARIKAEEQAINSAPEEFVPVAESAPMAEMNAIQPTETQANAAGFATLPTFGAVPEMFPNQGKVQL